VDRVRRWGTAMPDFRAYIVGPDGHFIGVREFAAADRAAANKAALNILDEHPLELWEGNECIGVFTPSKIGGNPSFKHFRFRRTRPTK
jgi:hypothetical protein